MHNVATYRNASYKLYFITKIHDNHFRINKVDNTLTLDSTECVNYVK